MVSIGAVIERHQHFKIARSFFFEFYGPVQMLSHESVWIEQ